MPVTIQNGYENRLIISDLQSNTLESLEMALIELGWRGKPNAKKAIVLSSLDKGPNLPEASYTKLFRLLREHGIQHWFGIGTEIYKYAGLSSTPHSCFESAEDLLKAIDLKNFPASSILITGSNEFNLDQVVEAVQAQSHSTVLEINFDNLTHNLNVYQSKLSDQVKTMVMVKAFGYGVGSEQLSKTLAKCGVDYLGVAYADEGANLRKQGIKLPIFVMNVQKEAVKTCYDFNLQPVIHSLKQLQDLCDQLPFFEMHNPFPVHLELNTGMNRLGFVHDDLNDLLSRWNHEAKLLSVESIFTHFPAAGLQDHNNFTRQQIEEFKSMTALLESLPGKKLKHICNTSGIENWPEAHFDMVRLGIGLFGMSTKQSHELKPVASLKTKISQIHQIGVGESVGYGRSYIADQPKTVATLAIGYADGLSRSLSNGVGKVLINGQLVPILGKICMDMTMIDVTGVSASTEDEVVVFGKNPRIEKVAESISTISYEVLSGISQRVRRIYIHE